MKRRYLMIAAAALLFALGAGTSFGQVNTTLSYCFGDSLTDNDDLSWIFGTDPTIYGADPFEAMFEKASGEGDQLISFAVLGSTSQHVLMQVRAYAEARQNGAIPAATLTSLQGGGNDFLDTVNLLTLASAPPGVNSYADKIVNDVKQNLMKCLQILQTIDGSQLVIWTVPDVTLTPYVLSFGLGATEETNIRLHIERLNQFIRAQGSRLNVAVLDLSRVLTEASLYPPVILGTQLAPTPFFGTADAIFADPIHPTAVANGILANELIDQLNEAFGDSISPYEEEELAELAGISP